MAVFTDKVDVDEKISLYEYGVIRNPLNGKTVLCTNSADYLYGDANPKVVVEYVSKEDVEEALEDVDDSFFEFIDSDREYELNYLDNDDLAGLISTLNNWNGYFINTYW